MQLVDDHDHNDDYHEILYMLLAGALRATDLFATYYDHGECDGN